jgi:hypothetical protein
MMRGAFGGFVILGLMALGEQAMNKHRLKQEIELKNFVREYQIQRELRQLKESYPGERWLIADRFGKLDVLSNDQLETMRRDIEVLMKSQGMA